jgi:hypothetical protein
MELTFGQTNLTVDLKFDYIGIYKGGTHVYHFSYFLTSHTSTCVYIL